MNNRSLPDEQPLLSFLPIFRCTIQIAPPVAGHTKTGEHTSEQELLMYFNVLRTYVFGGLLKPVHFTTNTPTYLILS